MAKIGSLLFVVGAITLMVDETLACNRRNVIDGVFSYIEVSYFPDDHYQSAGYAPGSISGRGELTGFRTGTVVGDKCVVAISVKKSIQIRNVKFVDDEGIALRFSDFVFNEKLSKELGDSFRAFEAEALLDMLDGPVVLQFEFTDTSRGANRLRTANSLKDGLYAAQTDEFESVVVSIDQTTPVSHAGTFRPGAGIACLGPGIGPLGLSACPDGPIGPGIRPD